MAQKKIIVSVTNDLYTDQRVHKVCVFLTNQGYKVLLVGRLRKNSLPMPERPYKTKRMKLAFEQGALFYAAYNFRLFLFLLFRKADILLANDLDTLLGNYAAKVCKPYTRIVYDSHEYFTEVPELQGRRAKKVWESIEAWILPKIKDCYTVNTSIAGLYQEKYKKNFRVVRNISPLWEPGVLKTKAELGIPEDKKIIIIQGAGINIDRGAEEAVQAIHQLPDACLLIVGDGDVVPQLKEEVFRQQLTDRVLFFGKQPYDVMMNYTWHADVGLTLDKDTNLNYKYSLPNKLFDYIHTNTPVVCTDLVEVARIVREYEVGEVIPHFSAETLATTLQNLLNDEARLILYKQRCQEAALQLNWEAETAVLNEIFPKIE